MCNRKLSVVWLSVSRACKELSLTEIRERHVIVPFENHWDVRWMLQGQMRGWRGAISEGHTRRCPVRKEVMGSGSIIRERLQAAMFWWPQQSFIKLRRAFLNHPVFSTHLDKQKWGILVLFCFFKVFFIQWEEVSLQWPPHYLSTDILLKTQTLILNSIHIFSPWYQSLLFCPPRHPCAL